MKNKSLIVTIFVLVAIIALAAAVYPSLADKATETTTAEQGSISDTVQYQKYKDVKIYDKEGKAVMLSDFEAAFKEYGEEIQFLIINTDDGIGNGEKFIADKGYTFPTYYDLEYNAAITYGISGIPRTIAIDKDGNIRYNRSGMIDAAALESIINMIK